MCRRGGEFEIVLAAQDACEHAVPQFEMLCEIIATQLDSGAFPPIIEWVDVRVAADGVGQQLLTPLWRFLTSLGKEVDAVVLYQDDAAFVRLGLGEHGAQVGTFET